VTDLKQLFPELDQATAAPAAPVYTLQDLQDVTTKAVALRKTIVSKKAELVELNKQFNHFTWTLLPQIQRDTDVSDIILGGLSVTLKDTTNASASQDAFEKAGVSWDAVYDTLDKNGQLDQLRWTVSFELPKLTPEQRDELLGKLASIVGSPPIMKGAIHHVALKKWLRGLEDAGKLTDDLRTMFSYEAGSCTIIGEVKDNKKKTLTTEGI